MCLARGRCSVNIGRLDYWVNTENREVDLLLDSRLKGEKLKGVFGSFRPFSWAAGPRRGPRAWRRPRAPSAAPALRTRLDGQFSSARQDDGRPGSC